MVDNNAQLDLLMSLPFYLNVKTVIFLKLPDYLFLSHLHDKLNFVFVGVRGIAVPGDVFDEVVLRDVDGCASESQPDNEAFSLYFFPAVVEVQVHKAFYNELS